MPPVTARPKPDPETPTPSPPSPGERYGLAERKRMQIESNAPHVDIDEISSADGLFAVISQRRANGAYTFAIFKSFDRGTGTVERTSFIPTELGQSWLKLATIVLERIERIRAEGGGPFKERQR